MKENVCNVRKYTDGSLAEESVKEAMSISEKRNAYSFEK